MLPPSWVTEKIYETNKSARLGWNGAKKNFALVELRPARAFNRSIIGIKWEHGPVFGRNFDPIRWVPFFIIPVPVRDVFSGKVIDDLKRWSTTFSSRALALRREVGIAYERQVSELAEEQGAYLYWKAQKSSSTGTAVPKKHLTASEKEILSGDYRERSEMELSNKLEQSPAGGVPLP